MAEGAELLKMLKWSYFLYRFSLYPLLNWVLPLFSKKISQRKNFEKQYRIMNKPKTMKAHIAFHVASEGELEQVMPLLEAALAQKLIIELVYTSPSLIKKIEDLQNKSDSLYVLPLPLITFNPFNKTGNAYHWLTAPIFVMCRYDFFPELLMYARKEGVISHLLWVTCKSYEKRQGNVLATGYYDWAYHSFDALTCATGKDYLFFKDHFEHKKIDCFDFRIIQIVRRQQNSAASLSSALENYSQLLELFSQYGKNKIILGSCYIDEFEKIKKLIESLRNERFLIFLCPHHLDTATISQLQEMIHVLDIPLQLIDSKSELIKKHQGSQVILFTAKGVLCEMYKHFAYAYVGGGYGYSVHSLFEPFFAGCAVGCGPLVDRSTEYDWIKGTLPQNLSIVKDLKDITKMESSPLNWDMLDFNSYQNKILNILENKC
jgi:3-deoxy-D-manno-octulosonic-acid transferase